MRTRFSFLTSRIASATLLIGSFWSFAQQDAHAYLDAGTGSMLLQVLMGSVLASLFMLKVFWRRALHTFNHRVLRRKMEGAQDDANVRS